MRSRSARDAERVLTRGRVRARVHRARRREDARRTTRSLRLRPGNVYILPSGYRIRLEKRQGGTRWRLVGSRPDGTLCHKPCTVSGGGKSEISKPITDAILQGPVFVADFKKDFDRVAALVDRDYSDRFRNPKLRSQRSRKGVILLVVVMQPSRAVLAGKVRIRTPVDVLWRWRQRNPDASDLDDECYRH